ncbi:hypothetical protein ILUMI_11052 [Ignelater luminosus]|uniref:Retroviral polymerase SH3-like domain-containing protein n=1 Tax=Ignelater luminosus TaxID=2038154 RepID=A0A8K0GAV8_IGNLU|nr:hypothetical protein ILUMI_11052 [Ignelater luminosus]
MWAEIVGTGTYTLNRTGKSSVEGASPYELWMLKKPRLKHLRIIGSACYAHIPGQTRRKMDKNAIRGCLVGYNSNKRYRIWIQEQNRIVLCRDVTLNEIPGQCEKRVKLPMRNIKLSNERKRSEDETIQVYSDCEELEENGKESLQSLSKNLRDRSNLKKPERYEDYNVK